MHPHSHRLSAPVILLAPEGNTMHTLLALFLFLPPLFPSKPSGYTYVWVRVCVTYLRSCRLSLSSTLVTVTNDALSIRIVRREGENGEHLLAPYPSWHRPYELLRFLDVIPFDVIPIPPLAMRLSLLYKLVSMGTQSPPTLFQDAIL